MTAMPLVPTSAIMVILVAAFFPSSIAYFFAGILQRLLNRYSLVMVGTASVMFVVITLSIFAVEVPWLSWVLLVIAIVFFMASIRVFRTALAIVQERKREEAERIAKGY